MAARQEIESGRGTETRTGGGGQDAIALLKQDHRDVERLFAQYAKLKDENQKSVLAEQICLMLSVHMKIEEELFYPAAKRRIEDKELVDESVVEHQSARQLIAEIQDAEAADPMVEARMQVLCEQITHHVHEEEHELFPEVQKADIDLNGLGARLADRKQELLRELGADDDDGPAGEPRSFGSDSAG